MGGVPGTIPDTSIAGVVVAVCKAMAKFAANSDPVIAGLFKYMFRYSILIFEMGAESIRVGRRPVQNINEVEF